MLLFFTFANGIENFIQYEKTLIQKVYTDGVLSSLYDIETLNRKATEILDELKNIKEEYEKVKQKKQKIDEKYNYVLNLAKNIINDINNTEIKLKDKKIKIKLYLKEISKLEKEINALQDDIKILKENFVIYTNFLYKINNEIYSKDLKIDDIKLLLKTEDNISKVLSTEDKIKLLSIKLKDIINQLDIKIKRLNSNKRELTNLVNKYKEEIEEYKNNLKILNEQKKYLSFMYKYIKSDKKEYDKLYEELNYSKNLLKKQLQDIILAKKEKLNQFKLEKNKSPKINELINTDDHEHLSWPVYPVRRISAYFEDPDYEKNFEGPHYAIDIPIPQGTTVYSPANGIVYKVFDNDSPALNWLIIVHKNGYITVYLHMYKIFVKEGDIVKRGQPIGLSGGKPGTRGAGVLTTGPHLHFEIIKDGKHIDPLTVLDLSVLSSSFKNLPDKYKFKYLKDKISRLDKIGKIKFIEGNTLNERRKNFLEKYAVGPFKDLSLWEEASKSENIDIDLGICIGFSETNLGKKYARDSIFNVGNVGNNDRGDRVSFSSPLEGAKAIYRVLNNRYLRKYYTLEKLSRYGNKDGHIYASSDYNWHKNMIKCLSSIKGFLVPDDYPFRYYKDEIN